MITMQNILNPTVCSRPAPMPVRIQSLPAAEGRLLRRAVCGSVRERGAVLVLALIFLVLVTIMALTASSSSMLQLRMAGNLRNAQQAQMSADTALRGAEWRLWTSARYVGGFLNCTDGSISTDGCVKYNAANSNAYGETGIVTKFRHGETAGVGVEYMGPGGLTDYTDNGSLAVVAQLDQNPRYIIEDLGRVRPPGAGLQCESQGCNGGGPGGGPNLHSYRITARGIGGGKNSTRVLQSTFDAQTNN